MAHASSLCGGSNEELCISGHWGPDPFGLKTSLAPWTNTECSSFKPPHKLNSSDAPKTYRTWEVSILYVKWLTKTPIESKDTNSKCDYCVLTPFSVTCAGRKGYYSVTFFQQIASIGNNIAIQIVAGISMKSIFLAYSSNPSGMTLQQFIIIFGVVELLLSQMPDIHSLRWLNALCTFCTVGFTITVIGLSIYACKLAHSSLSQMLKSYLLLTDSTWMDGWVTFVRFVSYVVGCTGNQVIQKCHPKSSGPPNHSWGVYPSALDIFSQPCV